MAENNDKKLGEVTFSIHNDNNLDRIEKETIQALLDKRSPLDKAMSFFSNETPMAIQIKADDVVGYALTDVVGSKRGDEVVYEGPVVRLVGFKSSGKSGSLDVKAVVLSDGTTKFLDEPFVVNFDRKTNPSTGEVEGAVTKDSARDIIRAITSFSKEKIDEILDEKNSAVTFIKYPVADQNSDFPAPHVGGKKSSGRGI
jgi:hypothetical protein